ncbi:P-loop NTPase fold protein [Oceanobacter kriegii]|uniref:P-loop NTPase fold protein n=1 Tax=Oceanobacter kriegii TaxID=64972 RepID=UPI00040C2ABA|nr:P-loop NTPase fold protein [Oceanobacter kriegii]
MEINKHVVDNLDYYLSLPSPEYAFLLCGEWGVGKTHFADEYIKKKNGKDFKLIKISLFGLRDISEINAGIFQKLHPLLGSKSARLAGNIIKGAFSMGLRIDIDSGENYESTLNTKLDKLNFFEFFLDEKKKEVVLIFDDLERSKISTVEVLGFINELVETSQVKVILIANEKVLIEGDDGDKYKDFKEKVIGKTFEVKHDFSSVLCEFLDGYSLGGHEECIQYIYNRSNFKNLRKFKQSIDDFEYLIKNIDDKYKANDQFYKDLVKCFFALSVEVKKGGLSEEDLRKNTPFNKGDEKLNSKEDIYSKYFSRQARLYNGDVWANIIFKGDLERINEETSKLALFVEKVEKERPNWLKLWYFKELENDEFSSLIDEVEDELKCLVENDLRIYLHKIALVTYFSKIGLGKLCIDEIKEIVERYISKYKDSDFWKTNLVAGDIYNNGTGYGYINDQDQDFIVLKARITSENEKTYNQEKQIAEEREAKKILDSIVSSIESDLDGEFKKLLLDVYRYNPILNNVNPKAFVGSLVDANNSAIVKLNDVILERYSENHFVNDRVKFSFFREELDFWKGVETGLKQILLNDIGLKGHILGLFLKHTVSKVIFLLSEEQ